MYQDKLSNLKKQLEELQSASHPELIRRIKRLEHMYHERLRLNEIYRDYMIECVEKDYIFEKNATVKEYEEKKTDLKDNLLADFEDKKKLIESERTSMELIESGELRQTITRKLRRRPNDPIPVTNEKRRKPGSGPGSGLVLLLDDKDVDYDLKLISRGKSIVSANNNNIRNQIAAANQTQMNTSNNSNSSLNNSGGSANLMLSYQVQNNMASNDNQLVETKIEDGKLLYERRWFHRGQAVFVEGKEIPRFSANISAIGNDIIWVKRTSDGGKVRIYSQQLSRGKISIKRRAN